MPRPTPLAVVLVDVGSTEKLTLPYLVERVMPVVQQHRLTVLSRQLSRPPPVATAHSRTPASQPTASAPTTDGREPQRDVDVATHAKYAAHPSVALHNVSLFAHTHVCAFAPRVPRLQHASWHDLWTAAMSTWDEAATSDGCHDTCTATRTPNTRPRTEGPTCLFGATHAAKAHSRVNLADCGLAPARTSCDSPFAVTTTEATAMTTHITALSVPPTLDVECVRVDAFVPPLIHVQEGARYVLQRFGFASSSATLSPSPSPGRALSTLALVCADHDVDAYVSFLDVNVHRGGQRTCPTLSADRRDQSDVRSCGVLLFSATGGLQYRCDVYA